MNTQRAYINGFVKRANEYGYSDNQAITLLKQATVADNTHTLNINSKPVVQPMAPKPVVKKDPMQRNPLAAYGPKINIPPVDPPEHVPMPNNQQPLAEHEIQSLADLPLSSMTPKDHWTHGLHDILAKRPVLATNQPFYKNNHTQDGAPTPVGVSVDHVDNLLRAAIDLNLPGYSQRHLMAIKGMKANDPRVANLDHIYKLKEHFKKYDPSWGNSFNPPVANFNPFKDDSIAEFNRQELEHRKEHLGNEFRYYVNDRASQQAPTITPQAPANGVNIPTGL